MTMAGFAVICLSIATAIVFSTVVHELGHAIAAVLVRHRLREISIGTGKPVLVTKVGSCRIYVRRSIFGGGHIVHIAQHRALYRLKSFVVLIAGVSAQVAAYLALRSQIDPNVASEFTARFLSSLGFLTLVMVASNLWPYRPDGLATDGMQIVELFRRSEREIDEIVEHADSANLLVEVTQLTGEGRHDEIAEAVEPLLAADPNNCEALLQYANGLIFQGRYADALVDARRARESFETSDFKTPEGTALIDNTIAYCIAVLGDPALLPEARERAERAYGIFPNPAVAGTLGAVLVQTGEPTEGLRLVDLSRPAVETPIDVHQTERFAVIGYLANRNVFQARQAFQRGMRVPGVDTGQMQRLAPALGAAEAALWLRRFAEGVVPTRGELADMATTIGFALNAWLSPSLSNERRWELFDQAGGDRATLSNSSLQSLAQLTKALQDEGTRV